MQVALAVVATFMNLTEAQVAASALESGALHPVVMDQGWGSVLGTEQFALQGFRLAVPQAEASDAIAFFRALPRVKPRRQRQARSLGELGRTHWWRPVAGLACVFMAPIFGWLIVGLRPRRRYHQAWETAAGMFGAMAIALVPIVVLLAMIEVMVRFPATVLLTPLALAVGAAVVSDRLRRSRIDPGDRG